MEQLEYRETPLLDCMIQTLPVSGPKGQKIWDTRHVAPGLYYFTLKTAQASKTGKLVIER